jgi:hypothetical protein
MLDAEALPIVARGPPAGAANEAQAAPYSLVVTADHGSVAVSPAKALYDEGEVIELIPKPDTGYCFTGWSGDARSTSLVLNLTMDGNKAITANFGIWTPPIGIPMPEFGIFDTYRMYDDRTIRNPALTYQASDDGGYFTHYVDNTNPAATNTNNTYGSKAKPRWSIPESLPTGSICEVHGGTSDHPYTYGSLSGGFRYAWFDGRGTATSPVFIRGATGTRPKILSVRIKLAGTYFVVENLELENGTIGENQARLGNHHVAVRNLIIHGSGPNAPPCIRLGQGNYMVAYNNVVYDNGDVELYSNEDVHAVFCGSNARKVWIVDNYMYDNLGDAVQICSSGTNVPVADYFARYIYIGRNVMRGRGENAIDLKSCRDVISSENCAYNFAATPGSDGAAMVVNDDYTHENIWFINNRVWDCVNAFRFHDAAYMINNVSENCGLTVYHPIGDITVINNTFYNGVIAFGSDCDNITAYIHNNIIVNPDTATNLVKILSAAAAGRSTMSNNLLYQAGGPARISWGRETANLYESLAAFQKRTGKGIGCVEGDPLFSDNTTGNYELKPSSSAINAGTSSGVVQEVFGKFEQLYGIDIRKDIEGKPRTGVWDIGAYEYILGAVTDLAVSDTGQNSVTVTWTAPGEQGGTGKPAGYDIRYSSSPLTEGNWDTATQVQGEPAPGGVGEHQSFTILGLDPGATYYIAIKVGDEAGHYSQLSNVVSATTDSVSHVPILTGIAQDTGALADDAVTSDPTLLVLGTADAGNIVEVLIDGSSVGTTVADGSGSWIFDYTGTTLANGTYAFTAKATNSQGNVSAESAALPVTVDRVAPTTPTITGIASDTGAAGDGTTSDQTLVISGTAEAGSTIALYINGSLIGPTQADGSGSWTYDHTSVSLANGTYTLTATATDVAGNTSSPSSTCAVKVDTIAPMAVGLSNAGVLENQPVNTLVGAFATTDSTPEDSHVYSLVAGSGIADNGAFAINGDLLLTAAVFDREAKVSYCIRVRSTDVAGSFCEQDFVITISDVNESPTDIQLGNASVPENQPSGATVGILSTSDPDSGDTFTYTLVSGSGSTDNASFAIVGSTLQTAASFNYEARNSYSIRVRSTDQGGNYVEKAFVIGVSDTNESPTDINLSSNSAAENQPPGLTVGTFNSTDPDTAGTFTYTLVSGAGSADNESFTISGSILQTTASFDYEARNSYGIRVRTTDPGGLWYEEAFTIAVVNVNEPPSAQPDNVTTDEDTPVLIHVLTDNGNGPDTDPEGNIDPSLTINMTSPLAGILTNNNDGSFVFDPHGEFESLSLGESAAVSFEYQVEDVLGLTSTAMVTITIIGVDDKMTITVEPQDRGGQIAGGSGQEDLVRIVVSLQEATNPTVEADFDAYRAHLNAGKAAVAFTLPTLNVTLVGFESFEKLLDYGSYRGVYENPIVGTNARQTLTGSEGKDLIVGWGGSDTLIGGGGDDILVGGAGDDTLDGGPGDDVFLFAGTGEGFDTLRAGDGLDRAIAVQNGTVIGINGYSNSVDAFVGVGDTIVRDTISSHTLDFSQTALSGIAEVDTSSGSDTVIASNQGDARYGGAAGSDTFTVKGSQGNAVTISILDFNQQDHDHIDLRSWNLNHSTAFGNLIKWQDEHTGDTIIKLSDTTTIRLVGFALAKLKPTDFLF